MRRLRSPDSIDERLELGARVVFARDNQRDVAILDRRAPVPRVIRRREVVAVLDLAVQSRLRKEQDVARADPGGSVADLRGEAGFPGGDPRSGELIGGSVADQAGRCLENLAAVCQAAGPLQ